MYRVGLGDCFLVTIPVKDCRPFQLLVDCGVFWGTEGAAMRMTEVAAHISQECCQQLDVVVVTHEHWDHVSGFVQARQVFAKIRIGEVWLPWTEDSADAAVARLQKQREVLLDGLIVAGNYLDGQQGRLHARAGTNGNTGQPLGGISDLLRLFGPNAGRDARSAVEFLAGHPSRPQVRFLGAGDPPRRLPRADPAQVYVLGPPHLAEQPAADAQGRDNTYGVSAAQLFFAAIGGLADGAGIQADLDHTFERRYRRSREQAEVLDFFCRHYLRQRDAWRQIDGEWLETAEPFALALDTKTNDNSLALAIELEPGGRVLLFPGDAQDSGWRGWSDRRWPVPAAPGSDVTLVDLLGRTVFYKVSHHGSLTGTPDRAGLALLTSPELAAMVPVCHATAQRIGWELPSAYVLTRLRQRARGRVLRSDTGLPERPDNADPTIWDSFTKQVYVDDAGLYVDYTIRA
jgi:beta-lactamase superfamily II metal-dependent hydrolase